MAETGAIRAGKAYVEISAKDKLLVRSLEAVKTKLKAMGTALIDIGKRIAALGTVAIAPFVASLKVYAEAGDAMAKMSQRTGIAVEALSQLTYAAEQSGASAETLEKGVRTMQRTIKDAADGTATAKEAFSQLGLTIEDLKGLTPDEQFRKIAQRISMIEDPAIKAASAMEVFGKGGAELLPLMADGANGIEQLMKRADALGLTMSGETANAAVEFGDHIADVRKQLIKVAFEVGATVGPAITKLAQRFQTVMKDVIAWVKANREAIMVAAKVAAGILAAGAALIALGGSMHVLAFAITPVILAAKGVMIAFAAIGPIIGGLLSPIGLVSTAFAALVTLFITKTDTGKQAMGALSDAFGTLKEDAMAAFGGIRDALASGDIAAAAKILWLTLQLEWERGTHALNLLWQSVKEGFVTAWQGAVDTAAKLMFGLIGGLKAAWVEFTSFFERLWVEATSKIVGAWSKIQEGLENKIHDVAGFFDSTYDAEQAKQLNAQARDHEANQRERTRVNRLAEIERERESGLAEIGKAFEDAVGLIDGDADRGRKQREEATAKSLEATAAELEAAKTALHEAIAGAKAKRAEIDATALVDSAKFADRAHEGLNDVAKSVQTRGTFNKFSNFQSLQTGGTNYPQQMVQEQRQAKEHLLRAIQLLGDIKLRLPAFS